MIRRTPSSTRCPYTTLVRSGLACDAGDETTQLAGDLLLAGLVHRQHRHAMIGRIHHPPARAHDTRVDAHAQRSEEHTSELQSRQYLVCRLLLEKKKCLRHAF